jgi:hypothetical protein
MTVFAQLSVRRLLPAMVALALLIGAPGPALSAEATAPAARDSKLVEYEVSEAVVERLMKWAGWFGFAVGIPMGVLALVLTVLGVRSYQDLQQRLADARAEVENRKADADSLQKDYDGLRRRYVELEGLEHKVREIAGRVDVIEKEVGFAKSKAMTPKLQASLEDTLRRYRAWLAERGAVIGESVTVSVPDDGKQENAWYENGQIIIDKRLARDPDVMTREYARHVLEVLRASDGKVGFTGLYSGIADYLACSFSGSAVFGAKAGPAFNRILRRDEFPNGYVRNLVNRRQIDEDGEEHDVGEAWGGAFWELRDAKEPRTFDTLLLEAWRTAPHIVDNRAGKLDFAKRLTALIGQEAPSKRSAALTIFARRGLDVAAKPPARRRAAA